MMRALRKVIGLSALLSFGTNLAADEVATPSAGDEFLEYLGSWDGDDADWQVVARVERVTAENTRPATHAPHERPPPVDGDDAGIVQE